MKSARVKIAESLYEIRVCADYTVYGGGGGANLLLFADIRRAVPAKIAGKELAEQTRSNLLV
jgi:hypothetical protein